MAAKKTAPKSTKVKKPAVAKTVPKKAAPAVRKPAAPAAPPVAKKAAEPPRKTIAPARQAATASHPAPEPERKITISPPVRTVDVNDDSEMNESLLSGPRNVQAYVVKRGEQYMSKEQLEHFRRILQSWKQDLMLEVDRTVSHMKDEAANFPDPNDRATQEEEFSLELRTRDRERKLIRKIDEALARIEDGSYGYCLETGEPIGVKRLEARPVATLSLEAQERRERRERQYGDRDDRYR
ncbi:MAG: RNA polymerase-binding protein DksA [Steroidobacteraceae bacterium]